MEANLHCKVDGSTTQNVADIFVHSVDRDRPYTKQQEALDCLNWICSTLKRFQSDRVDARGKLTEQRWVTHIMSAPDEDDGPEEEW